MRTRLLPTVIVVVLAISACGPQYKSASSPAFSLAVQDLMHDSINVTPWSGAMGTHVACGDGVTFKPGMDGAPPLPWTVSVTTAGGKKLLETELSASAGPKHIFVTTSGAQMVDEGGSHGAPTTYC
jgi:hypothetical protein